MPDEPSHKPVATLPGFLKGLREQQPVAPMIIDAEVWAALPHSCTLIWIENSCVPEGWTLSDEHIITGVPRNEWHLTLQQGQCIQVLPVGEEQWVVMPYSINALPAEAPFTGETPFLGQPFADWCSLRELYPADESIANGCLYPIVDTTNDLQLVLRWMLCEHTLQGGRMVWDYSERITAARAAELTNHKRLAEQRKEFITDNWPFLKA